MAETKTEKSKVAKAHAKAREHATKVKDTARGHGSGFLDFIRTQGVIGLAVGLAIGAAAGDTVKSS